MEQFTAPRLTEDEEIAAVLSLAFTALMCVLIVVFYDDSKPLSGQNQEVLVISALWAFGFVVFFLILLRRRLIK